MGSCCACSNGNATDKFQTGGEKDLSNGPILKRSCTDIVWVPIFIAHLVLFGIVTFVGLADGDPRKLYYPRDFKGEYCGMGDLTTHPKLLQMMNVSEFVHPVMQQLVCSDDAASALNGIMSPDEYMDYQCSCCRIPCQSNPCTGSLGLPPVTVSNVQSVMQISMERFTQLDKGKDLFSPSESGVTEIDFGGIFHEMKRYFVGTCQSGSCVVPAKDSSWRNYTYEPDADSPLKRAWTMLRTYDSVPAAFRNTINNDFKFSALPDSLCPYGERYCVPMPGINLTEAPGDYCVPQMTSSVVGTMGSAAASALEGLGSDSLAESSMDGIGGMVGEVWNTADALGIVVVLSFMVGLIFMVGLRFLVGCIVWLSLALVFGILVLGGFLTWVRSSQCSGASLFDSGMQAATAITIAAAHEASNAVTGDDACIEAMSGEGSNYRGCQSRTISGLKCQAWNASAPHSHPWNSTQYPNAGLTDNYCRNPNNYSSIWCVTASSDMLWEMCRPVGVIQPECPQGYMVKSEYQREALLYLAYAIWALAVIWLLMVVCLQRRIRLVIAINKVATMFIFHTPSVLLVPITQIVISITYTLLWALSASFLISQVPASYTSTESFATWVEAMGNETVPGKCNPIWPQGFAYKDSGNLTLTNDPCSGNMGDTSGITPRCYRCAPPRYVIDPSFALSFFSFLWNNALFVAMGQCIIAATVGIWFFTKPDQRGKRSPLRVAAKMMLRYHFGTMAFGSFVIALVQFIRYCLKYLEKQAQAQKNKVMVLVLKGLQCCIWCFEKCLKFLTKNAFIQCALMGTNFCTSAKNAFFLIFRNMLRFSTALMLGTIIQVIGAAVIIVATTLLGYAVLQALHPSASPVIPVGVYFAMSYVVARLYMNVFGLAVDTSLQCFIVSEEQQLDSDNVPGPLKSFFTNHK